METTMLEKVQQSENPKLQKAVRDPLIRKKFKDLETIVNLNADFKRIDISFIEMPGPDGALYPRFGIMLYDHYVAQRSCMFDCLNGWNGLFIKQAKTFEQRMQDQGMAGSATSTTPSKSIPETIDAVVEEQKSRFDNVYVAWEAEWNNPQGDPLIIGEKSGLFFLIAQFDLTKVESYVVKEF